MVDDWTTRSHGYAELLDDIKRRIKTTQVRAARAANEQMLRLYWSVGRDILARQGKEGWGSKVVLRMARDLTEAFPERSGWSRTNLLYMRRAAEVWLTEDEFVHHTGGRFAVAAHHRAARPAQHP